MPGGGWGREDWLPGLDDVDNRLQDIYSIIF